MEDEYLKGLDSDVSQLMERHKLSNQEFDKQVVYLAGGGLALTITFVKDITTITAREWLPVLLFSWIMFAATLILNLLSHKASYRNFSLMLERLQYYKEVHVKQVPIDGNTVSTYNRKVNRKAGWLNLLNTACVITSMMGVVSFIAFASLNFIFHSMPQESTQQPIVPATAPDLIKGLEATHNFTNPALPPVPQPTSPPASSQPQDSTHK